MPPKAQRGIPLGADESKLTAENFERELQVLAAKAKEETIFRSVMKNATILVQVAQILACAAVYSNLSQLTLAPVYGSIPASIWHNSLVVTACLLGWSLNLRLQRVLPRKPVCYLATIALYIPAVQHYLSMLSTYLGPTYGPILTEALTFVPLLLVSASAVALILEDLDLSIFPNIVAEAAPGIGSFFFFRAIEVFSKSLILNKIGANLIQSRIGLQLVIGGILARLAPSAVLLFSIPAILHTTFLNPHVQTSFATYNMNMKMERDVGFKVLTRHDSLTGYISVLENTREQYRVLRCDHSLLGGVWLPRGQAAVTEPIYGVFAMLEAVRLVEVFESRDPLLTNALVIGLGIGTTPSALISHGINTTVIEIDPIVRDYAVEYFSLPEKHNTIIADAVKYTAELANSTDRKFDYIIHDVFTGGAEPVDLFTMEFLANLHSILQPSGVIAINYAGDLLLPSARLVVHTILATFATCRVYRESAVPSASVLASEGRDFTNMVIFCTKQAASSRQGLTFRQPVEADYLRSGARKQFLMPKYEIPLTEFEVRDGEPGFDVLRSNDTSRLEKWHETSALGHWAVMRTVLPSVVWENW